jgi:hypothetical protein
VTAPIDLDAIRKRVNAPLWGNRVPNSDALALLSLLDEARRETERLEVQLAGCGVAAMGWSSTDPAKPGDYGWSASYGDVLALRKRHDEAMAKLARVEETAQARLLEMLALEADRDALRAALEKIGALPDQWRTCDKPTRLAQVGLSAPPIALAALASVQAKEKT